MKANVPKKKMDSIRVDTGVKKIEVNDQGDTISLNFADQSFPARYFAMVDEFEAQQEVFQRKRKRWTGNSRRSSFPIMSVPVKQPPLT